jgi:peptide deformylase
LARFAVDRRAFALFAAFAVGRGGRPMIRSILKYGDAVVHDRARPVDAITPDIDRLVADMIETMYAAPGIGLAAPQIGVPLRMFVVDLSIGRDPAGLIVMINPEFVEQDGMQLEEEGCLSVPGFNATVLRPTRAVIKGLDRTGLERQVEGTALLARAFQHEMDHLDGMLFVDRLRGIKRDLIDRRIRKLSRAGKW